MLILVLHILHLILELQKFTSKKLRKEGQLKRGEMISPEDLIDVLVKMYDSGEFCPAGERITWKAIKYGALDSLRIPSS